MWVPVRGIADPTKKENKGRLVLFQVEEYAPFIPHETLVHSTNGGEYVYSSKTTG
jgi:hypothetical protein